MSKHSENHKTNFCGLLTAYEMGILDDANRVSFESHLQDCPDCMEELFAMAPAVLEMQSNAGTYADAMEKEMAETEPGYWKDLVTRVLNTRVLVPLAATAAVVLIMINPFADSDSLSGLADFQALAYTSIEVRSGSNEASAMDFKEGMTLYQQRNYCEAGPLLVTALEGKIDPDYARQLGTLYAGVSYLMCDQTAKAVEMLNTSAGSAIAPVAQNSLWYLGQAHLLDNNKAAAVETLELLLDSPVYSDLAQVLLSEIEKATH